MSEVAEMLQHVKEVRQRLLFPPNAVPDLGIDLKRKPMDPKTPPTPPIEKTSGVLEYPIADCRVTIKSLPPPEEKTLKIVPILRAVSDYYGVTIPEIKSLIRNNRCVAPRHMVFFIAARRSGMSIAAIGRRFGKDHTTILHAVRKMRAKYLLDDQLAQTVKLLENRLFAGEYDEAIYQPRPTVAAGSESPVEKR